MPNSLLSQFRQQFPEDDRSDPDLTLAIGDLLEPETRQKFPDFEAQYKELELERRIRQAPSLTQELGTGFRGATAGLASTALGGASMALRGIERLPFNIAAAMPPGIGLARAAAEMPVPLSRVAAEKAKEQIDIQAQHPSTIHSVEEAIKSGEYAQYLAGATGQALPSLIEAGLTAIGGAAMGSAAGPVGTGGGLLTGVFARQAVKRLLRSQIDDALKAELGQLSRGELRRELSIGAQRALGEEAKNVAKQYGANVATGLNSYLLSAGEIYNNLTLDPQNPIDPDKAFNIAVTGGFVAAIPDTFLPSYITGRIFGGKTGKPITETVKRSFYPKLARFAGEVAKTTGIEGATEGFQEWVGIASERYANGQPVDAPLTEEDRSRILNAATIGGIAGFIAGPISGLAPEQRRQRNEAMDAAERAYFPSVSDERKQAIIEAELRKRTGQTTQQDVTEERTRTTEERNLATVLAVELDAKVAEKSAEDQLIADLSAPLAQDELPITPPREPVNSANLKAIANDFVERLAQIPQLTAVQNQRLSLVRAVLRTPTSAQLENLAALFDLKLDENAVEMPNRFGFVQIEQLRPPAPAPAITPAQLAARQAALGSVTPAPPQPTVEAETPAPVPTYRGTSMSEWELIKGGGRFGTTIGQDKDPVTGQLVGGQWVDSTWAIEDRGYAERYASRQPGGIVIEFKPTARSKMSAVITDYGPGVAKDNRLNGKGLTLDDVSKVYDKDGNVIYDSTKPNEIQTPQQQQGLRPSEVGKQPETPAPVSQEATAEVRGGVAPVTQPRPPPSAGEKSKPAGEQAGVEGKWYWGGISFDATKPGSFLSRDPAYAEKFASQTGGTVHEVELAGTPKVYPEPFFWQAYEEIFRKDQFFKGYDAVRIIEPNGQGESLLIRNPDIIEKPAQPPAKPAAQAPAGTGTLFDVERNKPLEAERNQIVRLLDDIERRRTEENVPLTSAEIENSLKRRLNEIEQQLFARAGQQGTSPPGVDVREPAGTGAGTPATEQTQRPPRQQNAPSPTPRGPTEGAAGTGPGGGISSGGGDRPGTSGRPGVERQPPGTAGMEGAGAGVPAAKYRVGETVIVSKGAGTLAEKTRAKIVGIELGRPNTSTEEYRYKVEADGWHGDVWEPEIERAPSEKNHVLPKSEDWIPSGNKSKVRANLDAIKLLKQLEAENRNPTPEEKAVLAKYTGWGGLKEVFDEGKARYRDRPPWNEEQKTEYANWEKNWGKLYDEVKASLSPEEYATASRSILNAHYTSREVINAIWAAVQRLGFRGGNALEPAVGVGHFIGLTPEELRGKVRWNAVEKDSTSSRITQKLYPEARVQQVPFEESRLSSNSQDLIVTNVPFDADGPRDKRYPNFSLHNYFFARSLDLVKPGGIVAAITSDSTMDSSASKKAREYFAERADLVGAIRLPNTAFKKNAGTEVTTDILFFRKRDGTPFRGESFLRTVEAQTYKGEPITINEYFVEHPEMMLGRMSKEGTMYGPDQQALLPTPGTDLNQQLAEAAAKLPENIIGSGRFPTASAPAVEMMEKGAKLGQLQIRNGAPVIGQPDGTAAKPAWADESKKVNQATAYVSLRDQALSLIDKQFSTDATEADIAVDRKKLNQEYDAYRKKYGALNERASKFLDDDVDFPLALALEDDRSQIVTENGKAKRVTEWVKSKMFTERTIFPRHPPEQVDTVADGLQVSQNFIGHVNPDYIAKLTGKPVETVKNELETSGQAFENPKTGQWENRATYLSGFVKEKLKDARLAAGGDSRFLKQVAELEKVQPSPIAIENIGVKLGSVFIPENVIERFLRDVLSVEASVNFTPQTGTWTVTATAGNLNERNKTTYGVHDWKGHELVGQSLNLKSANVYDTVRTADGTKEVRNPSKSIEAQQRQDVLQREFKKYVLEHPDTARQIAQIYNDRYNGVVAPKFDPPTWAHYPSASTDITLREHQKAVVTRMLQNSTLLAHAVGTGKTYAMTTAAMEMRRLGLAKKPMIVVQNATLEQFARSFKRLYPTARILVPNARERDATNRNKTMSRIATGDWDAVIIPQSFVNMLPDDPVRERQYIQDQINELKEAKIDSAREGGKRSPKAADLQKAIERLEKKLKEIADRKQDNVLSFEQLGVDALFVDEAHAYKKLVFFTKMDNIKGLDTGASQRGWSMNMKTRWVQEQNQGRNVVFATGTPVSNTIAEAWNMMRYVRPDVLKAYDIEKFDDFASIFGEAVTQLEMTPGGTWKPVTRFARYTNGPELIAAWRTVADVVTPEEINLPGLPALKNGRPTVHTIKQSPQLKEYVAYLRSELERFAAMTGRDKRENSHIPLVVFGLAKKASLDMRMINPDFPDQPGSKLNEAANTVAQIYRDSTPVKGAQMVFSDAFQDNPDGPRFNLYQELKKKLIDRGIPGDQIVIITPEIKDAKREALFARVNNGDVRVVIGSTERMGIGVNAQEHLIALHHLDAPPRPMDIEQRNGRILRQGNQNPEVEVHSYGVENTLDAAMFQKLATKQKFINQILRGDLQGRNFEDAANEQSLTFEEQMSAFSGDPRAMEKVGLENQVRQLEILRSGHINQLSKARDDIDQLENKTIPHQARMVQETQRRAEAFGEAFAPEKEYVLQVGKRTVTGRKDVIEALDNVFKDGMAATSRNTVDKFGYAEVPLSSIYLNGQLIQMTGIALADAKGIIRPDTVKVQWRFVDGSDGGSSTSGIGFMHSLAATLERIAGEPDRAAMALANEQRNLRELKGFVQQPFEREVELNQARQSLSDLSSALAAEATPITPPTYTASDLALREGETEEAHRERVRSAARTLGIDPSIQPDTAKLARLVIEKQEAARNQTNPPTSFPSLPNWTEIEGGPQIESDRSLDAVIAASNGGALGVLRHIAQNGQNPFYRLVAQKLADAGVNPRVERLPDGNAYTQKYGQEISALSAGVYNSEENLIVLTDWAGNQEKVFLHEMIHAASAQKIMQNPAFKAQLSALRLLAERAWTGPYLYGLKNDFEFLAEALSDPYFQAFLANTRIESRSLWSRFVDFIRGVLGLSTLPANLLEETFRVGAPIFLSRTMPIDAMMVQDRAIRLHTTTASSPVQAETYNFGDGTMEYADAVEDSVEAAQFNTNNSTYLYNPAPPIHEQIDLSNRLNIDAAVNNHDVGLETKSVAAIKPESLAVRLATAKGIALPKLLRQVLGLKDTEAVANAVLARATDRQGNPVPFNAAQQLDNFMQGGASRDRVLTRAFHNTQAALLRIGKKKADAQARIAANEERRGALMDTFNSDLKNYTDADALTSQQQGNVRKMLTGLLKNFVQGMRRLGQIEQQLNELEGQKDEPIPRRYYAVFQELFTGNELRGTNLFDLLETIATDSRIDLTQGIRAVRVALRAANDPAYAKLIGDTETSKALLATVVAYGKANGKMMAMLELRRMKAGEERAKINNDMRELLKAGRDDLLKQIRRLPRLAVLEERARQAYREQLKRVLALQRQVERDTMTAELADAAMPVYTEGFAELVRQLQVSPQFVFRDGALFFHPPSHDASDEQVKAVERPLSLDSTGQPVEKAALTQYLDDAGLWLMHRNRQAAEGNRAALTPLYYAVKRQRDTIFQHRFYTAQKVKTDRKHIELYLLDAAKAIEALGFGPAREISRMLREFQTRLDGIWPSVLRDHVNRSEREERRVLGVLNRGRPKEPIDTQKYREHILFPVMQLMEQSRGLEENYAGNAPALESALRNRAAAWLMKQDYVRRLVDGREQEFFRHLFEHVSVIESASAYAHSKVRERTPVRDPTMIMKEDAAVRRATRVGPKTFSRKYSQKVFGNMVSAMDLSGWVDFVQGVRKGLPGEEGEVSSIAELYNSGQQDLLRAWYQRFFFDPIHGATIQDVFFKELANLPLQSVFDAPVLSDGVTRLEADPPLVSEAYELSNGDPVKFFEFLYDAHDGESNKGQYVEEGLKRLALIYHQTHQDNALFQDEPNVEIVTLRGMVAPIMSDARIIDNFPGRWFDYHTYDHQDGYSVTKRIAAQDAFGYQSATLAYMFQSLRKEIARDLTNLANVEASILNADPIIGKKEMREESIRRVGSKAEFDRLDNLRNQMGRKGNFLDGVERALIDFFRNQNDPIVTMRTGIRFAGFIAGRLVEAPGPAITQLAALADPIVTFGVSLPTIKFVARNIATVGRELVNSLGYAIGVEWLKSNRYEQDFRALGLTEPSVSRQAGDAFNQRYADESRLARGMRFISDAQSFALKWPGTTPTGSTIKPLAPFRTIVPMVNKALAQNTVRLVEDYLLKAKQFLDANESAYGDPGHAISPKDMGLGPWDRQTFERLRGYLSGWGLDFDAMAREAKRRLDKGETSLVSNDDWLRLNSLSLHEISLEAGLVTTPFKVHGSGFMQLALPLLRWQFARAIQVFPSGRLDAEGQASARALLRMLAGVAFTGLTSGLILSLLVEEYNKRLLGKKQNLRPVLGGDSPEDTALALLERTARVGVFGSWGELVNTGINVGTGQGNNRAFSLDQRIVAANAIYSFLQAGNSLIHQGEFDYARVGRPMVTALGGSGMLQYAQIVNRAAEVNLLGEGDYIKRLNVRNILRVAGRQLDMDVQPARAGYEAPTPLTPYITRMDFAVYQQNPSDFKRAYREAIEKADDLGRPDPVRSVQQAFSSRHPLRTVFRASVTEADYRRILQSLPDDEREDVQDAVKLFNRYGSSIGVSEFNGVERRSPAGTGLPRLSSYDVRRLGLQNLGTSSIFR